MATFNKNKKIFTEVTENNTSVVEKGPKFYRFYNQTSEIFWSFVYPPSQRCLDSTCKMLRYPNCMEITEEEYKKGKVD